MIKNAIYAVGLAFAIPVVLWVIAWWINILPWSMVWGN